MNGPAVTRWDVTVNGTWTRQVNAASASDAASVGSLLWRTHVETGEKIIEKLLVVRA